MPKIIQYPRSSLSNSLKLAEAVYDLGGSCTEEMSAEKLGKKLSGSFRAVVSSTGKYGLIERTKGQLYVTDLYKNYKMAYSDVEAHNLLKRSFLNIPVFQEVVDRFANTKVPLTILDKLFIREFNVSQNEASKIAGYFINGAKKVGLMNEDGTLNIGSEAPANSKSPIDRDKEYSDNFIDNRDSAISEQNTHPKTDTFTVRITGPGVNTLIEIREPDDIVIVEALLKKVKRSIDQEDQ